MQLLFPMGNLDECQAKCLVVFADREGKPLNGSPALTATLTPYVESGEFGKSAGGNIYLANPPGVAAERVLFYNIGEKVAKADELRRAAAGAWKLLREKQLTGVTFSVAGLKDEAWVRAAAEGFILGEYQYTELKSERENLPARIDSLAFHGAGDRRGLLERWHQICLGTNRARDLCQMPPNILNPTHMASLLKEWGAELGYQTQVLDEDDVQKEGMGTFMSVAQGSETPGKFIIMTYEPPTPAKKTFVLVGKAVTFDSGGLSLKPANGMADMKGDMGGGAAVAGIMSVLKVVGCPHKVVGLVPAVENMPSGQATRPSDVVTSLSGLTVEINNTDAEGRLIMADALTYAERYKPDYVVDFATLTGACLVALGPKICGVMGNHQPLVDAVLKAGESVHETFWQLPLFPEYDELLKSPVADVCNVASIRWGGTITAGLFLQRFAKQYKWAHCDIAAAIFEKGDVYHPSGGTGIGVRMALEMMDLIQD